MSITFSQGKLQADERQTILQTVQKQAKAAALQAIRPVLKGFLEAEVTAKLGRAKGVAGQISSVQLIGSAHRVDVAMPVNLLVMDIADAIWRRDGDMQWTQRRGEARRAQTIAGTS